MNFARKKSFRAFLLPLPPDRSRHEAQCHHHHHRHHGRLMWRKKQIRPHRRRQERPHCAAIKMPASTACIPG